MIAGGATVIFWITSGLNAYVYEILPGILTSSLAIIDGQYLGRRDK